MPDVTAESIKTFLKKVESDHKEAMPTGAQTLLQALTECEVEAITVAAKDTITFDKPQSKQAASGDNTIKFWNTKTGSCANTILQTPEGELSHSEKDSSIQPISIRGDAWRYRYAKDEEGNIVHPCQYEHWGTFTPLESNIRHSPSHSQSAIVIITNNSTNLLEEK